MTKNPNTQSRSENMKQRTTQKKPKENKKKNNATKEYNMAKEKKMTKSNKNTPNESQNPKNRSENMTNNAKNTPIQTTKIQTTKIQATKPKKLALSLATATLIAGFSLDSLVAGCTGTNQANHSSITCSGSMNVSDMWNPYLSIGSTTYNINNLTANGGNKTLSFRASMTSTAGGGSNYLNINSTNANTSSLTVSFDTGNYSRVSVSNTRLGSLTVGGSRSSNSININSSSNISTLTISSSNSNTNVSSSTIGTLNVNNWVGTLNINNSSVSSINNNGSISNLNLQNSARVTNLTNNANKTISNLTITNSSITGKLDNKGTINTLRATNSTISNLTNSGTINTLNLNSTISNLTNSGTINTLNLNSTISNLTNSGTINTLNLNSSSINSLSNTKTIGNLTLDNSSINSFSNTGTITGNLTLQNGSKINGAVNVGTITGNLSIIGKSSIGSITGGTISGNLVLGNDRDRGVFSPSLESFDIKASVSGYLAVYSASLKLDSAGSDWNSSQNGEHIAVAKAEKGAHIADGAIYINIGKAPKPERDSDNYETKNLVVATDGTISNANDLKFKHIYTTNELTSGPGSKLIPLDENNQSLENASRALQQEATKFRLEADVPSSFGAAMYRSLTMGNIRRNIMTQNILDTMTTKTFRSDKFYNQEVELRLLQYEMSRITNRSSKFNKLKRKNEKKLDRVREKMAKLTLEQSKGQDIDKGYNNFELLDQLDVAFIPYSGKRDWRLFALPYASHTYGYLASNQTQEYAVGGIFGVQRNLRKNGIFGGYMGYEFSNSGINIVGASTTLQTNSLQAGINYFKTYAIAKKVAEGFLKVNVRGGVDLPQFRFDTSFTNSKIEVDKSKTKSLIPLMYNVGAEISGGVTFYQFKRNSYIAPTIGLSYDFLSMTPLKFDKPFGASEAYNAIYWHLPQASLGVRYYKVVGNKFRFNTKLGVKYNFLSYQKASFKLGQFDNSNTISLPKVYGNLAFDFIWSVKKNHEISLGYDGLFFASSFAKKYGEATQDWFNGVTTTINLKYAYWFGGTDYKTDKDGNVVGSNKSKKTKKSKSKKPKKSKEKKSKKKIVYIDG
ncbi:hypothetical protein [Helicobacter sp. T3_23-1059]